MVFGTFPEQFTFSSMWISGTLVCTPSTMGICIGVYLLIFQNPLSNAKDALRILDHSHRRTAINNPGTARSREIHPEGGPLQQGEVGDARVQKQMLKP